MTPTIKQTGHGQRGARAGADSVGGFGLSHQVLDIQQAAKFLHLHPVTLQRMAHRGDIPAAKLGRRWIFLEIDLVASLRAQYPSRVMQGEHKEEPICRSTNVKILPCIGSNYHTAEKSYREALGLPTR